MRSLDLARPGPADAFLSGELIDLNATLRSTYGLDTLVIRWSESLRVVKEDHVGWVLGPAEMDPIRTAGGRCVIPSRQRRQLRALAGRGVPAQRLAVVHEVATMPDTYDEPRLCTCEEARRLVGPVPADPRLVRTVGSLKAFTGEATAGPVAATGLLDHMVLGVVAPTVPEEGEPAVWILLVSWRW